MESLPCKEQLHSKQHQLHQALVQKMKPNYGCDGYDDYDEHDDYDLDDDYTRQNKPFS